MACTGHDRIVRVPRASLGAVLGVGIALGLGACSVVTAEDGRDSEPAASSSAPASATSTVPRSGEPTADGQGSTAAAPVVECGEASQELLDGIAVNARPEGTFTPLTGAFVQATNDIFVVAIRFEGLDGEVVDGAWTAIGVEPPAPPYLSANEAANLYTAWETVLVLPGYGVALDDPAIGAALDCLPA